MSSSRLPFCSCQTADFSATFEQLGSVVTPTTDCDCDNTNACSLISCPTLETAGDSICYKLHIELTDRCHLIADECMTLGFRRARLPICQDRCSNVVLEPQIALVVPITTILLTNMAFEDAPCNVDTCANNKYNCTDVPPTFCMTSYDSQSVLPEFDDCTRCRCESVIRWTKRFERDIYFRIPKQINLVNCWDCVLMDCNSNILACTPISEALDCTNC